MTIYRGLGDFYFRFRRDCGIHHLQKATLYMIRQNLSYLQLESLMELIMDVPLYGLVHYVFRLSGGLHTAGLTFADGDRAKRRVTLVIFGLKRTGGE